ncbi:hypothetical protein [Paenibacillus thalictri]|uniref:hypothetical protein n=1 Tax=Paenibacillus thalictri TaxID=2527873 RepID=UPI00147920BA|nr:hypothetical protein [Paenibacillus thalictri]
MAKTPVSPLLNRGETSCLQPAEAFRLNGSGGLRTDRHNVPHKGLRMDPRNVLHMDLRRGRRSVRRKDRHMGRRKNRRKGQHKGPRRDRYKGRLRKNRHIAESDQTDIVPLDTDPLRTGQLDSKPPVGLFANLKH